MSYKRVHVEGFIVAGVSETTNLENELSFETSMMPQLWQNYFQKAIVEPIEYEVENSTAYALYTNYEDDGELEAVVGARVSKKSATSTCRVVQDGEYLLFEKSGDMPKTTVELWESIREFFDKNTEFKRAFLSDFEVYESENRVRIYIGIK